MPGPVRPGRQRRADLSQHFLRDASARRLVQATSISKADLVVEIGPGRGALTTPLMRRAGRVIGVELDVHLANRLRAAYADLAEAGRAEIVTGDFLAFDPPRQPYTVVGNVPFAGTSHIVRKITDAADPPRDAWLVVQQEFAHSVCGRPFARESLWSLRLKPRWHLEIVAHLQRNEFDPPPSVAAVFLHLHRRARPLIGELDLPAYEALLRMGFGPHRNIVRSLRACLSRLQLRRLAADYHFDVDAAPGDLVFEQWLGIFRFLRSRAGRRPLRGERPPADS